MAQVPANHFVRSMGIRFAARGDAVEGWAELHPSMWAGGTRRPRLAVLATFVDVVAGHVAGGARIPTVDLRVQATGGLPSEGDVRLFARPLNVGRSLVVSDTVFQDAQGRRFAHATATFKNQLLELGEGAELPPRNPEIESYEALLEAREVDPQTLEIDPLEHLGNGFWGTVLGGAQAMLAECAAERVARGRYQPVDLDIRFLGRLEKGPLRARARSLGVMGAREHLIVELVDAGARDRLVSRVSLVSQDAGTGPA